MKREIYINGPKVKLANILYNNGIISFGRPDLETVKFNPKSLKYCKDLELIGYHLFVHAKTLGVNFDCVVGLPDNGDALTKPFMQTANKFRKDKLPCLFLKESIGPIQFQPEFSEFKKYKGATALLIGGVIFRNIDSVVRAIKFLEDNGFFVEDMLALIDAETLEILPGSETQLWSIFKITELLRILVAKKMICRELADKAISHICKQP